MTWISIEEDQPPRNAIVAVVWIENGIYFSNVMTGTQMPSVQAWWLPLPLPKLRQGGKILDALVYAGAHSDA